MTTNRCTECNQLVKGIFLKLRRVKVSAFPLKTLEGESV